MTDMTDASDLQRQRLSSFVGAKWETAVTKLSQKNRADYEDVSSFIKEAASERNKFIHEGTPWGITRELSKRCINSLWMMVSLFVALHNEYTQPVMRGRDAESPLPG